MDDQKFIKDYEYAIKIIFGKNPEALLMHMHPVTLKVTKRSTLPLRPDSNSSLNFGLEKYGAGVYSVSQPYFVTP